MVKRIVQTAMREERRLYQGLFGNMLHEYAVLVFTNNDRFIVRLGDDHRNALHAFTYLSHAEKFLQEQNEIGKAEVVRLLALEAAKAGDSASGS